MKDFLSDLFKILTRTVDGLIATTAIATILARSIFMFASLGKSSSILIEGFLYAIIILLMLIRLRVNDSVSKKFNWGAALSVLAFFILVLILR